MMRGELRRFPIERRLAAIEEDEHDSRAMFVGAAKRVVSMTDEAARLGAAKNPGKYIKLAASTIIVISSVHESYYRAGDQMLPEDSSGMCGEINRRLDVLDEEGREEAWRLASEVMDIES